MVVEWPRTMTTVHTHRRRLVNFLGAVQTSSVCRNYLSKLSYLQVLSPCLFKCQAYAYARHGHLSPNAWTLVTMTGHMKKHGGQSKNINNRKYPKVLTVLTDMSGTSSVFGHPLSAEKVLFFGSLL